MFFKRIRKLVLLLACLAVGSIVAGCTTPTAVGAQTQLQGDEGLVVLRLVDTGSVAVKRFIVVSTTTGQEYPLRPVRFGQTSSMTYVGRLPAGRYQPARLFGERGGITRTIPLKELTGTFDVQARRVTQLGTMVFAPTGKTGETQRDAQGWSTSFSFVLPLDPTPVATKDLLAARFPELAKTVDTDSSLGWVPGSLPVQPPGLMAAVRARVETRTQPQLQATGIWLSGGSLGTVARLEPGRTPRTVSTGVVHAVEAVVQLRDGRWLAGGEEGFLAVSADAGAQWQRLPELGADTAVIHLSQAADGAVFVVTDHDREVVVHRADPVTLALQAIRRIPAQREQGAMHVQFGEAAAFLPNYAQASANRLVVHARPNTLASLDLRTGRWETHATPRTFEWGLQVTADGHVVGAWNLGWVWGSADYGQTWTRLDVPSGGTLPRFADRRRGVVLARAGGSSSSIPYRYFSTGDGGKTWTPGPETGWMDPTVVAWPSADFQVLYRVFVNRLQSSQDQGATWR